MAANVAGVVVGTDQWNVATRYDPATNTIADLAPYFPSNYKAGYAWAINDAGVMIGHGYRAGGRNAGSVAWMLPAEAYPGPKFPSHIPDLIMRILFGVIQDGGGVGLRPSGPTPVGPLGPLSPAKSDMLAALAVGELADLFTNPELKEMVANLEIELLTKGVAKLKRR